ncbi:hypothetical protein VY88_04085 [Azospirillum thiophilum]|uniref:Uncharacterized protein n=1 Tax=Azospirillum thiophilum TaxID=528244 RepID=A0AAC8VWY2_9PROT|nr:hypothetical protein AL072_08615 [Azospirillum thiophilum]KJR65372.1 hypothetical protein VY88_04085 [Azospirillum thiophilum]
MPNRAVEVMLKFLLNISKTYQTVWEINSSNPTLPALFTQYIFSSIRPSQWRLWIYIFESSQVQYGGS